MQFHSVLRPMSRVILAPNDDLTPFDLKAQIFRVNVELSVYYRGQKMSESDLEASYSRTSKTRTSKI